MTSSLNNQVVLVTGGGRGIGKDLAMVCAEQGAKVVLLARSQEELNKTQHEIENRCRALNLPPQCLSFSVDVCDHQAFADVVETVNQKWGNIYGLIAAAGVYGSIGSFLTTDFSSWSKGIDINLKGTAAAVHLIGPQMVKAKEGRIILFSGGGQGPLPKLSSYVTSKGAIWRFTETVGAELALDNVYLNAIAPGAINTRFLDDLLNTDRSVLGEELYTKAMKQKESGGESTTKAAELCLYLLSEKSKGLYGKTISAVWDPYKEWTDPQSLSRTDLYTYKRVTPN